MEVNLKKMSAEEYVEIEGELKELRNYAMDVEYNWKQQNFKVLAKSFKKLQTQTAKCKLLLKLE